MDRASPASRRLGSSRAVTAAGVSYGCQRPEVRMTTRVVGWGLAIGLSAITQAGAFAQTAPPQNQPTFRAVTSLVPIDVRVLDRNGRPLPNLVASDFTIFEDGAAQKLGHFSVVTLATSPTPSDAPPLRRGLPPDPAPLRSGKPVRSPTRMTATSSGRGIILDKATAATTAPASSPPAPGTASSPLTTWPPTRPSSPNTSMASNKTTGPPIRGSTTIAAPCRRPPSFSATAIRMNGASCT